MKSSENTIPVGNLQMPVYVAQPEGSGPHPAVIVLQEIFGLNAEMRRVTDLLASVGYVGIAINFYHRNAPNFVASYDEAGYAAGYATAGGLTQADLIEDIAATVAWLNRQDFVKPDKVATWGFCFGGGAAFLSATLPGIVGAVCFYGGQISRPFPNGEPAALERVPDVRCPVLLCYGADDAAIAPEAIERVRSQLADAKKTHQIEVYPNVGHDFFRRGGLASDEASAEAISDSWNIVQTFLRNAFA
ncbi:MAG: dienelactone hydrolase family protein [Candidatus Eremiobacteraeota bacterium]|nr:dienelactone hydrolase family protein [Candidatus Eremiobacteraeota bacterium]